MAKTQRADLNTRDDYSANQVEKPLEMGPAPWTPGETCWYSLKTMAGLDIGRQILTVDEAVIDGSDLWQIAQYLAITANNYQQFSRVDALKEDVSPVIGRTKNDMGDIIAS
jgi:hypothetical protein